MTINLIAVGMVSSMGCTVGGVVSVATLGETILELMKLPAVFMPQESSSKHINR